MSSRGQVVCPPAAPAALTSVPVAAPDPPATPPDGASDPFARLAERARGGEDTAFAELVCATSDRLYRFLYHLCGHAQDAEDLTQETYLKAYHALDRYDPRRPFLPWLFTIARRTLLNHRRAARPHETLSEELPASAVGDPSTDLADGDALAQLWRLARGLHPRYHHVLWLYYGEGFDARQTAAILRTSPLVVKVLLHRARRALLAALRRHRPELLP